MFNEYLLGLVASDVWHGLNGLSSVTIGCGFLFMLLNYLDPENRLLGGKIKIITLRTALVFVMTGCFMNVADALGYILGSNNVMARVAPTEVILNIGLAYVVFWSCGFLNRVKGRRRP